jgi:hypothetical protein
VLDLSHIAGGVLSEVGFFDVYPQDDNPAFNGAWSAYPFFASGSVAVNGIEQGLFVVRPRASPRGQPNRLSVTIAGPGSVAPIDQNWSYVVRVANDGPGPLSDTRVLEMLPATTELVSLQASQGKCSASAVVSCELGSLAPGSEAFVIVSIRAAGEDEFVSSAIVSARAAADGSRVETSALTVTRGIRATPALTLRRPLGETTFRLGRNNTIQWTLRGVAGGLKVELSRDDGTTWATLSDDAENVGFYDWTGTGPETSRARVRITSASRPELTQTSNSFSIVAR